MPALELHRPHAFLPWLLQLMFSPRLGNTKPPIAAATGEAGNEPATTQSAVSWSAWGL